MNVFDKLTPPVIKLRSSITDKMIPASLQKSFFVLLVIFIFSILSPKVISAQILFSDNFDHGISSWETYSTTGEWEIINEELVGSALNSQRTTEPSYALAGSPEWENYSLRVKIKGNSRPDKQIIFRVSDDGNYYVLNIVGTYGGDGNVVILAKKRTLNFKTSSVDGSFLHTYPFINKPEEWYYVDIHVKNIENNANIKVYINEEFILEANDSNPVTKGKIGFEVWPGEYDASPLQTINYFDDVLITEYAHELNYELSVENLKQYNINWSNEIYDNAQTWSKSPTIGSWGCALTSAAMILRFYGYDIFPNTLNYWLLNQPDGFINGGHINWLAISRFTKLNADANSQILKYRRYDAGSIKLKEELSQGRPQILHFPGHFVVAKGKINSDFLINDPASDKNLLSNLENTIGTHTSISSYIPTNTDLSYMLFVVNKDIQITLRDDAGNPIEISSYIQKPLQNNLDQAEISGETLQIFILPEPRLGTYHAELTGKNGPFSLDAYFYTKEGVLIDNKYTSIVGVLYDNIPMKFEFDYNTSSVAYSLANHLSAQIVSVSTNKELYKNGDVIEVVVDVTNNGNITFNPTWETLNIKIEGPDYKTNEDFSEQKGLSLAPGESKTYIFYTSPKYVSENLSPGNYKVHTTISSTRIGILEYISGGVGPVLDLIVDNSFPVTTEPLISPADDSFWNSSVQIEGISTDNLVTNFVNLFYKESSTPNPWALINSLSNLESDTVFDWSFLWTPTEGTYDLKASAVDEAGNEESGAYVNYVTYDVTAPDVKITSPTSTLILGTVPIRGTVADTNPHHYWLVIQNSGGTIIAGPGVVNDTNSFSDKYFFNWNTTSVPDGIYTIKLEARDSANNKDTGSVQWMKVIVDNTSPTTTIETPLDYNFLRGKINVMGTLIENTELSHYNFSIYPGGSDFNDFSLRLYSDTRYLSTGFTNQLLYEWDTTAWPNDEYLLRFAVRDKAGNRDLSSNPYFGGDDSQHVIRVAVDNENPTITWTSPAEGAVISGPSTVGSTTSDVFSGIKSVIYYYKKVGEAAWHTVDVKTSSPYKTTWDTTGLPLGDYTLKAVATDNAGNYTEIFRSVDVAAVISGESWSRPGWGEITINWTTDRPTDGRAVYDTISHSIDPTHPNSGYANTSGTVNTSPKTTNHTVTLTELSGGTTYYWRTISAGSPTTISAEHRGDTFSIPKRSTGDEGTEVGLATSVTTTPFFYAKPENASIPEEGSKKVLGEETEITTKEQETPFNEVVNTLTKTTAGKIIAICSLLLGLMLYHIYYMRKK